ncbi:hypothetical protein CERZMDRAFT_91410 [Cercospora zeae-maydis SCOH1-5]|uniref:Uncharacterized protein n=1 Tax=Cercospora zeae-maydis SCOH1-5 TaxID=717836 RepID=A0A6A6F6Q0_9PEZI|nr:hypothetical protein CERZMDRAFT_91410 [Cercospora zeae-maydis SCOH1-5]
MVPPLNTNLCCCLANFSVASQSLAVVLALLPGFTKFILHPKHAPQPSQRRRQGRRLSNIPGESAERMPAEAQVREQSCVRVEERINAGGGSPALCPGTGGNSKTR